MSDDLKFRPLTSGLGFDDKKNLEVAKRLFSANADDKGPKIHDIKPRSRLTREAFTEKKLLVRRVMAFFFDLLIIFLMTTLTFFLFSKVAVTETLPFFSENIAGLISISVVYYFAYFMFLDLHATLGKMIFKLHLISLSKNHLTLRQTLTRATVTFFSAFLVFFPLYFSLHEMISDSKIEERQ